MGYGGKADLTLTDRAYRLNCAISGWFSPNCWEWILGAEFEVQDILHGTTRC